MTNDQKASAFLVIVGAVLVCSGLYLVDPFWRACVVLGPHGDDLREHDRQDLMHRAMEEMDNREELEIFDRALDRLWSAELDRYCHRCDEPLHKCSCAELEEWINERWAGAS